MERSARVRLALALLWGLLVLALLPIREVMPPDEPRFAQVAAEMRAGGHWIVPTYGGEAYTDKPPLLFWAINLASLPFGRVTELSARLPSAIAALCVLLMTARLGRRLFASTATGFAAAVLLLTSLEFFQKAQWVSTDMLLAALTLAAAVSWREALFRPPADPVPSATAGATAAAGNPVPAEAPAAAPPQEAADPAVPHAAVREEAAAERRRRRRLLLGWIAAACATLTKGPLGLLWPLAWVLAEAAARRRWAPMRGLLRPAGPALYALLVGGWLFAAETATGGGFVREVLLHQSVERYVSAWNNQQPFHYYLRQLPLDLAPWSLFLPAVLLSLRRGRPYPEKRGQYSPRWTCALLLFAAIVFFSISSGKRGVYLLPAFPAAALLIARAYLRAGGREEPRAAWRNAPLGLLALAGLALGLLLPVLGRVETRAALGRIVTLPGRIESLGELGWPALMAGIAGALAVAAGAAAAMLRGRRGRTEASFAGLASGLIVLFLLAGTVGGAIASRRQGAEPFGQAIASLVPPGAPLAIERGKYAAILFYSGRLGFEFEGEGRLLELIENRRPTYIILSQDTFDSLRGKGRLGEFAVRYAGEMSERPHLLLALQPDGAAGGPG